MRGDFGVRAASGCDGYGNGMYQYRMVKAVSAETSVPQMDRKLP